MCLVGCAGSTRPERLPRGPKRHEMPTTRVVTAAPPPTIDQNLDARWAELAIDGDNWAARLDTIPGHLRALMATRFLREGDFQCDVLPLEPGKCQAEATLRQPTSASTLADPCLRRLIALWSLDQISDPSTLLELHDELTSLVMLPEPERALPAAAIAKMPNGFLTASAIWDAKTAGHRTLMTAPIIAAMDHDDLRIAAETFHLDEAVRALDPTDDLDVLTAAIHDDELLLETRLDVLDQLVVQWRAYTDDDPQRSDIYYAMRALNRSKNCTMAAAASGALAQIGAGKLELPSGPFGRADQVIAAACATLSLDVRGQPWKQVVAKHGVAVANVVEDPWRVDALWTQFPFAYDHDEDGAPDVPDADPDGDGDARTTRDARTASWSRRFTLPYADELRLALPHCDGTECRIPGSTVWFHLDIAKDRGTKLRLRGIERHERLGSDC